VTGDSLREFFFELDRIRDEKISDQELNDAKNFLTGVFPIRAETQEGLTNLIVNQQLYELPEDYLQTYRQQVDAVSADDVRRVARLYVRPEEMAMVIVGDAREIIPLAAGYADAVEVFDTDGKPLESSDQAVTN
jgi:zinc protease